MNIGIPKKAGVQSQPSRKYQKKAYFREFDGCGDVVEVEVDYVVVGKIANYFQLFSSSDAKHVASQDWRL